MKRWGTETPDEAVNCFLLKEAADEALVREAPEVTEEEFVQKLREAQKGPYYDYVPGQFLAQVEQMIREREAK